MMLMERGKLLFKINIDANKRLEKFLASDEQPQNPYLDNFGNNCWFNDKRQLHREDGPARSWYDGSKEWWHDGKWIGYSGDGFTQEDFERYLRELKIKEYW